jgi:hypothetical protein
MLTLKLERINPPIPVRTCDWQVTGKDYEPGAPIGYGRDPQRAIEDYLGEYAFKNNIEDVRTIKYKWS